jgi:hypothetical protein
VVYTGTPSAKILYTGTRTVLPQFTPSGYVAVTPSTALLRAFAPKLREFLLNLSIVRHARLFPFVYPRLNITYQQILTDTVSFLINSNALVSALLTTDQTLPGDSNPSTDNTAQPITGSNPTGAYLTDNTVMTSQNIAAYNTILEYIGTYSFVTPILGGTGGTALVYVTNEIITSVSVVAPGTGYSATGTSAVPGGTGGIIFFTASGGALTGVMIQAHGSGYVNPTSVSVPVPPLQSSGLTYYWDIPVPQSYVRFAIVSPTLVSTAFDFTINAAFSAPAVSPNSVQYIRLFITLAS